jgi:N-acetyl-D-muramate 6-phosphate phosphatase
MHAAPPLPRPVRAVLFDLDGTLADTAGDLGAALNDVRAGLGLPPLHTDTLRPHASAGARGMIGAGIGIVPDDPRYESLRAAFLGHYERRLDETTRLFDGVPELLAAIEARGLRWAIVTNKATRFTSPVVASLGLDARAGAIVCGDTTPHAKPHPEPLLHAARTLGVDPADCVYVGDDLRDIVAGNAAGMASIVAGWGYLGFGQHPREWPASARAECPGDLIGHLGLE